MLTMDEAGYRWHAQLAAELAWLRECHPDKTALIGVAEGHLDVIRRAGSCESMSYPAALTHPPAVERLVAPNT
jgi:hypothetical protein